MTGRSRQSVKVGVGGVGVGKCALSMVKEAWSAIEAHRNPRVVELSIHIHYPDPFSHIHPDTSAHHVKSSHMSHRSFTLFALMLPSEGFITNHYLRRCDICPINHLLLCGHYEQTTNESIALVPVSPDFSSFTGKTFSLTPPPPPLSVLVLVIFDSGVCHAGGVAPTGLRRTADGADKETTPSSLISECGRLTHPHDR